MLDIVTRFRRSVLEINIQFVKDDNIVLGTIGMVRMKQGHTGKYIAELLCDTLKDFGINLDQLYALTSDNGSNVLKSREELELILEKELHTSRQSSIDNVDEDDDFGCDANDMDLLHSFLAGNTLDHEYAELIGEIELAELNEVNLGIYDLPGDCNQSSTRFKSLSISGIHCAAHTLQLAINEALIESRND